MELSHSSEIMQKIRQFFSQENAETRVKVIVVIGLTAIMLIVFSDRLSGYSSGTVGASAETGQPAYAGQTDYEAYTRQLENRLTELISSVEGAGETKVMVTLECGTEYVYASQQKTTSALSEHSDSGGRSEREEKRTGEESLILVDGSRGEEPLIRKEITPTVAGVVVVCSGADNVNVRQRITDIVTTALGTSSNRVCVTRMG